MNHTMNIPIIGKVSTKIVAIACLITVAFAYSLLSIGSRLLAEGFQPMTQVYLRISIATVFLIGMLWKKIRWGRFRTIPINDLIVLLVMGTIGYSIAVYFVTLGAINAKLVNVSVIFASVPFFSYLYAYIFLKKPFRVNLVALLCLSLIGIAIVATKSFIPQLSAFGKGEWFTLLATATMATFYVGRKRLSSHLNTSEITISVMTIAAISGYILSLLRGEMLTVSAFSNPSVLLGLAIGVGMNILVNPIEIFAFNHLDSVLGTQILLLENIFSLTLGYLLYHEMVSFPEIIGGIIIIGSVFIANTLINE